MSNPAFRINHQIRAAQVRLLREDGTQVGVVPLASALAQAVAGHTDLVEVAPAAVPPVVKMIDYQKFKYQLAKKEQASRAAQKKVDLKEIRLTPFMAENDFSVRVGRGRQFLAEGHKLRINVRFVGRQLRHREFGDQLMTRAVSALADVAAIDQLGKWVGKQYIATLTPTKKKNESQNP